jgi:tetratricopeptide (TPR) repeat protein
MLDAYVARGGEGSVPRFRVEGWRSRALLLLAWLGVVAGTGALGAVRAPGLWLAAGVGVAVAVASLVTARVEKALGAAGKPAKGLTASGVPGQLPPSVGDFTGRRELSRRLRAALLGAATAETAVVITAVSGQGGVGKTALAIRVGHELAPRFPDGQLYVNLRGTEEECADPGLVLADFLRDLGVDRAAIPDELAARSRLYRSRLAGRRMLVILDNARDEPQLRPLLPGTPSCAVIVTSRSRLAGLEGVTSIAVDALTAAEAIELLARVAGQARVAAEPEEARAIAEACGYLPLAVRVAGARLAARPEWPLRVMADRLRGARSRLDELKAGDLDVRASLALSYAGLSAQEQRAFRLLGLLRAADFAAWPLASLLAVPLERAAMLAETLADAYLLQPQGLDAAGQDRYRFHDLVRDFARERLEQEEGPGPGPSALQRFLGMCLSLTEQAEPLLEPGGFTHSATWESNWPRHPDPALRAAVQADPVRWYEAERSTLVTAVKQAHGAHLWEATWELADNLCAYHDLRSLWDDWEVADKLGWEAARQARSSYGEAVIRRNLGNLDRMRGRLQEAHAHYRYALDTFDAIGDGPQIADTLGNLAGLYLEQQDYAAAASCLERSRLLFEHHRISRGQGWAYQMLAVTTQLQGNPQGAHPLLDRAEALFHETGDRRGLGRAALCRGDAFRDLGDTANAVTAYETALVLLRKTGDLRGIALVHAGRAQLHAHRHGTRNAISEYELAVTLFREINDALREGEALLALGSLQASIGNYGEAGNVYRESLAAFRSINYRHGVSAASDQLNRLDGRPRRRLGIMRASEPKQT